MEYRHLTYEIFERLLPSDERLFIIETVLRRRAELPIASRKKIERLIRDHFKIDGFRDANRAHPQRLLQEATSHFFCCLPAWGSAWFELFPELENRSGAFLRFHNALNPEGNQPSPNIWPEEEVRSLIDQFKRQQPGPDSKEVLFMVALLLWAIPIEPSNEGSHEPKKEIIAGLPEFAEECLLKLEAMSPDALEWAKVDDFIQAVKQQVNRHVDPRIGTELNRFASDFSDQIAYFGWNNPSFVGAEGLSTDLIEESLTGIQQLRNLLQQHRERRKFVPNNRGEEIQRQADLDKLETSIDEIFGKLQLIPSRVPPQSPDISRIENTEWVNLLTVIRESKVTPVELQLFFDEVIGLSRRKNAERESRESLQRALDALKTDCGPEIGYMGYVSGLKWQILNLDSSQFDELNHRLSNLRHLLLQHKEDRTMVAATRAEQAQLSLKLAQEQQNLDASYSELQEYFTFDKQTQLPVEPIAKEEVISLPAVPSVRIRSNPPEITKRETENTSPVPSAAMPPAIFEMSATASLSEDARLLFEQQRLWNLLDDGFVSLAFNLALGVESEGKPFNPPSWLISSVAVAPYISYETGLLSAFLKDQLSFFSEDAFSSTDENWNHSVRFLLAAACLRPGLSAPSTGASGILRVLHFQEGLGQLHHFCELIAEYGDRKRPVDAAFLQNIKDQATWESAYANLAKEVETWYRHAPNYSIRFKPALEVWKQWLEKDEIIGEWVQAVLQKKLDSVKRIRDQINGLTDEKGVRREIERMQQKLFGRHKDIAGSNAIGVLFRHLKESVKFANQWLLLCESRPDGPDNWNYKRTNELQSKLASLKAPVLSDLSEFKRHHGPNLQIKAAAELCSLAVSDICAIFDPGTRTGSADEANVNWILNRELLLLKQLPIASDFRPEVDPPRVVEAIMNFKTSENHGWVAGFHGRTLVKDHWATARILEIIEADPDLAGDYERLNALRESSVNGCQDAHRKDLADAQRLVEEALALGFIREEERHESIAKLEAIDLGTSQNKRYDLAQAEIASLREAIARNRSRRVEETKQRLKEEVPEEHPEFRRIRELLDRSGDILTANEYIDMVQSGISLPDDTIADPGFRSFFPALMNKLAEYLESTRPDIIIKKLKDYSSNVSEKEIDYDLGPLLVTDRDQALRAANLLESWFILDRSRRADRKYTALVLEALGFKLNEIIEISGKPGWSYLTTEPLEDRLFCPLPVYGSGAGGRYRLFCTWSRPSDEELFYDVFREDATTPVITFYFGQFPESRRRSLAALCREKRKTVIVIDDPLILHLCGESHRRMRRMFEYTLPFTSSKPYSITAGLVPAEMFYGRERERAEIVDPMGSCFIYGGRQLGKTALLRDVQRRMHDPGKGIIAVWIDLKDEGIGYHRGLDEFWSLLINKFKKDGILDKAIEMGPERLRERIRAWLEEDPQRRILLLLDEADRFLESDGLDEFKRSTALKGIMENTNRRFKIVFAGLHNVLRTIRQANHPLAHFGTPICIGPLLEGGEWREARALIEEPFRALGYYFDSPDLPTRILSQTNYYPSLIQLYCNELLNYVGNPNQTVFDSKDCPPYFITGKHVEKAYHSQELRNQIRERFGLTLGLDKRYEVITYCMALEFLNDAASKHTKYGLPVHSIRDEALKFWPEGFQGNSQEEDFRALLDEMVGMGVLRPCGQHCYSLRNPNLLSFLGFRDTNHIEELLYQDRELDPPYEPAYFRSSYKGEEAALKTHRSPLTQMQEAELKIRKSGVSVIFGSQASCLGEVRDFLESSFGSEYLVTVPSDASFTQFDEIVDETSSREPDQVTIIYVPPEVRWSEVWLAKARQKADRLTSKKSYVRFVFGTNPQRTWDLVSQPLDTLEEMASGTLTLKPWNDIALRQWLQDLNFPYNDRKVREGITEHTGNWPLLLYSFYERAHADPAHWEATLHLMEEGDFAGQLIKAFGLDLYPPVEILRHIADLGEVQVDEFIEFLDNIPAETIRAAIKWGELMNLTIQPGQKRVDINPLVKKLLRVG